MSCAMDSYVGPDPEELENEARPTTIETRGNVSNLMIGEDVYPIEVNPVVIAEGNENIVLDDTVQLQAQDVMFSHWGVIHTHRISEELISKQECYLIRKVMFQADFWYLNMVIPVRFTREIVSAIRPDGLEITPSILHQFRVSGVYCESDPMITDEESHIRSYYDLTIEVFDHNEPIGTLEIRVSFFTANAPIMFSTRVYDWENADVNI